MGKTFHIAIPLLLPNYIEKLPSMVCILKTFYYAIETRVNLEKNMREKHAALIGVCV